MENLISWIDEIKSDSTFTIKPYPLKVEEVEAFRYRVEDVVINISKH